jgi:hypothetical protein
MRLSVALFLRKAAGRRFYNVPIFGFQRLKLFRCPRSLAPTLGTLPSMSFNPFTSFSISAFQVSAF